MRNVSQILSVDDDENDAFLLRSALRARCFEGAVHYAMNGEEALVSLGSTEVNGEPEIKPDLVLLDLKMPKMNGLEVLRWMRSREATRLLPVVMFTSSEHPDDIRRSYGYGANYYVVKPSTYDDLIALVDLIREVLNGKSCDLELLRKSPAFRAKQ